MKKSINLLLLLTLTSSLNSIGLKNAQQNRKNISTRLKREALLKKEIFKNIQEHNEKFAHVLKEIDTNMKKNIETKNNAILTHRKNYTPVLEEIKNYTKKQSKKKPKFWEKTRNIAIGSSVGLLVLSTFALLRRNQTNIAKNRIANAEGIDEQSALIQTDEIVFEEDDSTEIATIPLDETIVSAENETYVSEDPFSEHTDSKGVIESITDPDVGKKSLFQLNKKKLISDTQVVGGKILKTIINAFLPEMRQ